MAVYDIGDRAKIYTSTVFTDDSGTPADPSTITISILEPDGTETDYVYGVGGSGVIRDGVGDYYKLIDLDASGKWDYRIKGVDGSGNNMGADDGFLMVRESEFS